MGLNWAGGLRGAAEGMEGLVKLKQQETSLLYDEVKQQNQFRFQKQQAQEQRDFLSTEKDEERAWKLENEIPLKKTEIEQRGELARLQQESLDTQRSIENQLREQANQIQQTRAGAYAEGQKADTAMDRERLLAEQKKIIDERWDGFEDSFQARTLKKNDPAGYKAKLQQKEDDYVLASLLPSEQSHYIDAQKGMPDLSPEARREIGKAYATMTPEQRDRVWSSLPQNATGTDFGKAVRDVKDNKTTTQPAPAAEPQRTDTSMDGGGGSNNPMIPTKPEKYDWKKSSGMEKDERVAYQARTIKQKAAWKNAVEEKAKALASKAGIASWYQLPTKAKDDLRKKAEEILSNQSGQSEPEVLWADAGGGNTAASP